MTSGYESSTTESPPAASFWTLDRIADALSMMLVSRGPAGNDFLRGVSTDTRSIAPGDIFVALAGPTFDAHDFLPRAVESGAAALVVSRAPAIGTVGVPIFHVQDTLRALGALARYRRTAWGRPVIGVAGSNGKTTTKDLIRAAVGAVLTVHATTGNLNNLVGVPLTLLAISDEADVAVIEIGTNVPGEVARLRDIALPDIAVVTSVGEEHLEGLGSMDEVLREETSVYAGATVAIAPASQPEIVAAARALARRVVTAGLEAGDLGVSASEVGPDGLGSLTIDGVVVRPPVRGAHNLRNAALALAVARECGVAIADAARGMAAMPVPSMRMAWEAIGSATLVNDAYNANPPSMRAAIDLLSGAGNGRQRVAILGTMREMGVHADRVHTELAKYALASRADVIAAVGDMAYALEREGANDSRVVTAPDVAELWAILKPRLALDAVILLKASRGVRLERLIPMLTEWAR
ncbi:MAG: UDP-N-acetylmuramoyl-tripeptide--D-alanyl-D-alanine ligase [Gemmatimonadaceae bacterium]|nr:UDP-N-acetylmuramoyl-tripeptide--D-alanyl-D-alanine ligase [Gemmatimonadaceae bacterium]MDQ3519083.1 UDP-N-acetylmuramoyl-tripeptide--D-alanyl-D-alanine ligase [Gemmatimonadota bacterium]